MFDRSSLCRAGLIFLIAAASVWVASPLSTQSGKSPSNLEARGQGAVRPFLPQYHPYDPSAPERMLAIPPGLREWDVKDIENEIRARVDVEKHRREIVVNYYRIGYPVSFPLPLISSPKMDDLPIGIRRDIIYPWYTWLSWALEERWRLLHTAWRRFGDSDAGALLQSELAALVGWDQYCETKGSVSLSTAHISACLAQALSSRDGWDAEKLRRALSAAERILEREAWPWFEREWAQRGELAASDLHNIRVIGLARFAQLARVVGSPRSAALEARAREALRAWYRLRAGESRHTEGSAYDGFLLDSVTGWLGSMAGRDSLLAEGHKALMSTAKQWICLTLPGRIDAQAPLGDVEPEMPFWMTALLRIAVWRGWTDAEWLVRRLPVQSLPAAFLADALRLVDKFKGGVLPEPGASEYPHALALRTGWESSDILAAVGLTRGEAGHLHNDAGQLVLGWRGRFWITDPGYQQYRQGVERDFSIGAEAHNVPVVGGKAQARRAPKLISLDGGPGGLQRAVIDLSACYEGLPRGAYVEREVRLLPDADPAVVVRDRVKGLESGNEVQTFWQGGTDLAWAFKQGWARLSDGERAVWIGVSPGSLSASDLDRHEGTRGPLTLHHAAELTEGGGDRFWVFVCDEAGGWEPPAARLQSIIQSWDGR